MMAFCINVPLVLVLVAAQDTSSPTCTQPGHSLIQSRHSVVSARLAANIPEEGTVPMTTLEGARALISKANSSGFSQLVSRPHLSTGDFCRSHPCSLLASVDKRRGLGATAAMDEVGYQAVAQLKDDEEMKAFILRVISDYDCRVDDEGGFMGMVPWFSGTAAVQSFDKLVESLLFAVLANGERWISYKNTDGTSGLDASLDLQGYMEVAIIDRGAEMETFARRLAKEMNIDVVDEGGFAGMIKYHNGAATFQGFDKLQEELKSAASSPHSWAKVASLMQSKRSMLPAESAVNLSKQGAVLIPVPDAVLEGARSLTNKANRNGFSHVVARPHLSNLAFCRNHPCSLLAAKDKRRGLGVTAAMDEAGYQAVAALKDDEEMKAFMLRAMSYFDCKVDNEGGFMGMVPWFSGTAAVQSFDKLAESLLFAVLANGERWISYQNTAGTSGSDAPLDLRGYMEVAIIRKGTEMETFTERLAEQMGIDVVDKGGLAGMVKYHSGSAAFQSFDKLQKEIKSAASSPHSWAKVKSLIQSKRSMVSAEPAANILADVSAEPAVNISGGGAVPIPELEDAQTLVTSSTNRTGFSRLVSRPHLSKGGFCRRHPCSLLASVDKRRGLGATAAMNEAGYQVVATLKDDEEMKAFMLRVISSFDCKVDNEGGFMGMVPWFSGTAAVQSFNQLVESLLFAVLANGERWISYKNTDGTSGSDASLDLQGYMEVAIINSGAEMETFARRLAKEMGIEVVDEGGLGGMIKYHNGAATFQGFDKLQEELKSAASSPHSWAKVKSM